MAWIGLSQEFLSLTPFVFRGENVIFPEKIVAWMIDS